MELVLLLPFLEICVQYEFIIVKCCAFGIDVDKTGKCVVLVCVLLMFNVV